jgi:hypothetical protein
VNQVKIGGYAENCASESIVIVLVDGQFVIMCLFLLRYMEVKSAFLIEEDTSVS